MEIRREMKQSKTENIDVNEEFQSQENPLPCPPEAFSKPTLLPDVLSIEFGLFLLLLKGKERMWSRAWAPLKEAQLHSGNSN